MSLHTTDCILRSLDLPKLKQPQIPQIPFCGVELNTRINSTMYKIPGLITLTSNNYAPEPLISGATRKFLYIDVNNVTTKHTCLTNEMST